MALYAATATTVAAPGATTSVMAFRASSTQRAEVRRIRIFQRTAGTAPNELLILRSTTMAVTPGTTTVGNALDSAAVATTGQLETTWGTAPVVGATTTALESIAHDATVGNAWFFEYDLVRSLFVPAGGGTGSIVFYNLNASGAQYRITVHWEE